MLYAEARPEIASRQITSTAQIDAATWPANAG